MTPFRPRQPVDIENRKSGVKKPSFGAPRGIPGAAPLSPGPSLPTAAPATWQITNPLQIKPANGVDILLSGFVAGVTAAGGIERPASLEFEIPTGMIGVVRSFDLLANNVAPTAGLVYRMLRNGAPAQGWGELTILPRNAASVTKAYGPEEVFQVINAGETLGFEFEVTSAGAFDMGVTWHGWYFPQTLFDTWRAATDGV